MSRTSYSDWYRRGVLLLLWSSLLVGSALRFVGLGFGRGVLTPRPDEELARSAVYIALTGDLNPHYAVWGHLLHDVYSVLVAVWLALSAVMGSPTTWVERIAAAHSEPWTVIWIGRCIS